MADVPGLDEGIRLRDSLVDFLNGSIRARRIRVLHPQGRQEPERDDRGRDRELAQVTKHFHLSPEGCLPHGPAAPGLVAPRMRPEQSLQQERS